MGRRSSLRARDVDALRRELAPFLTRLRYLSKLHDVSIATIIKHASLPDPINVLPVPVKGMDDWNSRIAGQ